MAQPTATTTPMDLDAKAPAPSNPKAGPAARTSRRSLVLHEATLRSPPFSYLHLELFSPSSLIARSIGDDPHLPPLDPLTAMTHLRNALTQFLGLHGAAVASDIDLIKVESASRRVWVRVPREHLSVISAALAGWRGSSDGGGVADESGERVVWRVKSSGDWLGPIVGTADVDAIWGR